MSAVPGSRHLLSCTTGGMFNSHQSTQATSRVPAEYAETVCECGEMCLIRRPAGVQASECPQCGRRLFVLPRSPYPPLAPLSETDISVVEEPQKPARRRRKRHRETARSTDSAQESASSAAPPVLLPDDEPTPKPPKPSSESDRDDPELPGIPLEERKRLITPLRVVSVVMVLLIGATAFWLHRRSVRLEAEKNFRVYSEAGDAALKDGKYGTARWKYLHAVEAADILERDDYEARRVRQLFRECQAASRLCRKPLFEILQEAERRLLDDPKTWETDFRRNYAGTWLVLDTTVHLVHEGDGTERLVIDYPLSVNGRRVVLDGNLPALTELNVSSEPRRVILGVELKSCRLSDGENRQWVVTFERSSAFLWTSYAILRKLGFAVASEEDADVPHAVDTRQELLTLLNKQSRILGLSR